MFLLLLLLLLFLMWTRNTTTEGHVEVKETFDTHQLWMGGMRASERAVWEEPRESKDPWAGVLTGVR